MLVTDNQYHMEASTGTVTPQVLPGGGGDTVLSQHHTRGLGPIGGRIWLRTSVEVESFQTFLNVSLRSHQSQFGDTFYPRNKG